MLVGDAHRQEHEERDRRDGRPKDGPQVPGMQCGFCTLNLRTAGSGAPSVSLWQLARGADRAACILPVFGSGCSGRSLDENLLANAPSELAYRALS